MTNNHPPGDSTHMKQLYNSPALQQMQAQHSLAAHLPQPKQTDSKPTNGNSRNSTSPVGGVLVWSYGGVLFIYSPSLRCFLPSTHFILQSKQLQDAVHHQLSSHCAHSSLSASNSPPLPAAEISAEFDRILLMNRPGFYSIAHLVALDHRHVSITLHELDLVFCYDFQTGAYTHIVHPPHLCSAGGASANAEANLDSRKQLAHPAITQMVKYVKQPTSSSSSSTSAESSAAADSFSLLCTVKTSDNSTTVSSSSSSLSSSYTCSVALLSLQHGLLSAWNIHAQTPSNAVATSPRHSTELNVVAVCAIELSHAVYYALAFDSPQPQAQLRVYHMESGLCLAVKAAHTAKIVQLHPIRLSKLDSGSATDRGKRVDDCQALLSVSEVGEVKVWSIALDCLHCLMTLTPQMIYGTPSSPVAQQSFRVLQGGPSSPSSSGGGSTSAPSSTATTQSLSFNTYNSSSTTSIMSALSSGSASPFVLSPRVPVSDQVASVKFSSFISAVGQLLLSLDNGVLLFFQLQSSSPSTASSSSSLSSLPSTPFCCSCHSTWTFQLLQRVNLQHLNTASGDVDDNHTHLQHDDDEKEERKHENLRYVTSVCHRQKDSVNDCTLWLGENNGRVSEWRWSKTAVKSAWSAAQSPTASKSTWNPFSIPPISLPSSGSHPAPTMRWYAASVVFDPHSISVSQSSSSTTAHSTCSSPCSSLPSSPCSSARGSLVMNTNARTAAAVVDEELDALLRKQARQLGKHQRFAANHLMFI